MATSLGSLASVAAGTVGSTCAAETGFDDFTPDRFRYQDGLIQRGQDPEAVYESQRDQATLRAQEATAKGDRAIAAVETANAREAGENGAAGALALTSVGFLLGSVYCIARLFGAPL